MTKPNVTTRLSSDQHHDRADAGERPGQAVEVVQPMADGQRMAASSAAMTSGMKIDSPRRSATMPPSRA